MLKGWISCWIQKLSLDPLTAQDDSILKKNLDDQLKHFIDAVTNEIDATDMVRYDTYLI